ncbi:CpaD family pilus assembly lipoprotein [Pseudogemmobacter humi]|uniref:Pilus biogenesis CpaD protein (Pilus_cpaD) n=1 Tax=Pseudogemmobacter humi TaxID=2483812 RepID=A0A3P5X1S4_9RHOB|nr:CpaD family pilus assembly lipoprotein [Pseudogemmobacter humi]VDC21164.1 Pilus biogenesis CpaD protein (pilus_cpaD) [Pseudogemmobacter humi]
MSQRLTRILLPLMAAVLLAACAADRPLVPTERISPQTHEAVLSYSFLSCSAEIGAAEQKRIRDFLNRLGLTAQDRLVVSVPKNRLPARDAERRRTLSQIFAAWPAQVRFVQDEDFRELPQSEPTGIIRVVRTHGVAVHCPDGQGATGCAGAHNLAAMIAHPADTFMPAHGRRYLPASGARP